MYLPSCNCGEVLKIQADGQMACVWIEECAAYLTSPDISWETTGLSSGSMLAILIAALIILLVVVCWP